MIKRLDRIARIHKTDKSSEIHNYCEKYERYFPFNRLEPIIILEIGVQGGNSLLMWRDYYPNARIIGIDINPECKIHEDLSKGIHVEIGSQDDEIFLKSIVDKFGKFDLILDDGSHINRHIIKSFECLFDYVKPEGIYVVEDSCTSYWPEYEGGLDNPNSNIEYFKKLVDMVNFNGQLQENFWNVHARREDFLIEQTKAKNLDIRTDIESINFLNSIIIITKR